MENFGDRLSVDNIWRVVLFIKTIPNHTLRRNVIPEPADYIVWQPSKELLAWVKSTQQLANDALDEVTLGELASDAMWDAILTSYDDERRVQSPRG